MVEFPDDGGRTWHYNRLYFSDNHRWFFNDHHPLRLASFMAPFHMLLLLASAHAFGFLFQRAFLGAGVSVRLVPVLHEIHLRYILEGGVFLHSLVTLPFDIQRISVSFVD
jgi:GT2 family glycosyltransferase